MSQKLHIIDALGPFFIDKPGADTVNWSKVIFSDIETGGRLSKEVRNKIVKNFKTYVKKVASLGYDAVSIDDLAHLTHFDFYEKSTKQLIDDYHVLYKELFAIAQSHDMAIYINTDYLFSNKTIDDHIKQTGTNPANFFIEAITQVLDAFPEIQGVILRIGENDGNDVRGTFLSKLLLRTPVEANKLLQQLLPVFENRSKQLIFRTWTVGAYKIGDLIWNEKTYDAVFSSINSSALIVSMKFGDTDFMRYLSLNPLFFRGSHKKILELQTRREWEGMGTIPSFVGWDYEHYLNQLRDSETFIGIHVWCQTGGWAKQGWTNLTYLDGSSFWNELNTEITILIADGHHSVETAIAQFCQQRKINDVAAFTQLLRLSETAIKKGFYIADLAEQTLYFRRTRIPPLLWLTWDRLYMAQTVVYLHRMLIPVNSSLVDDGALAVTTVQEMRHIAKHNKLGKEIIESIEFELATLELFVTVRSYIAGQLSPHDLYEFNTQATNYERQFKQHYSLPHLSDIKTRRMPKALLRSIVRDSLHYRKRDRVFIKSSALQARLLRIYLKRSRSHLASQSMGIETLFK